MKKNELVINASHGLHARPATELVNKASSFQSEIYLSYQDRKVNAKSIMGILSLAIPSGATIEISATGIDEDSAIYELVSLLQTLN